MIVAQRCFYTASISGVHGSHNTDQACLFQGNPIKGYLRRSGKRRELGSFFYLMASPINGHPYRSGEWRREFIFIRVRSAVKQCGTRQPLSARIPTKTSRSPFNFLSETRGWNVTVCVTSAGGLDLPFFSRGNFIRGHLQRLAQ